jgi:hypothetical protein
MANTSLRSVCILGIAQCFSWFIAPAFAQSTEKFETTLLKVINSVVDAERFGITPDPEATLLLNTSSLDRSIQIKCERLAGFLLYTVIRVDQSTNEKSYSPNPVATIWVSVCKEEAKRIRGLAVMSEQHVVALKTYFERGGALKGDYAHFLKSILTYSRDTNSRGAELFYFPVAAVGHGIIPVPTLALISRNQLQATVVQIGIPLSCMKTNQRRAQISVCADPKSAANKIVERIYGQFGE